LGEMENAYNFLVLGRSRRSWEDNIRMDLKEIRREGADWIHVVQDTDQWRAVLNTVMNLRIR
jgi:hypothetical protein